MFQDHGFWTPIAFCFIAGARIQQLNYSWRYQDGLGLSHCVPKGVSSAVDVWHWQTPLAGTEESSLALYCVTNSSCSLYIAAESVSDAKELTYAISSGTNILGSTIASYFLLFHVFTLSFFLLLLVPVSGVPSSTDTHCLSSADSFGHLSKVFSSCWVFGMFSAKSTYVFTRSDPVDTEKVKRLLSNSASVCVEWITESSILPKNW